MQGRGKGAAPGLRTAKTTLAAVISWELALRLPGTTPPVLAPLTALLVTQLTLVKTITGSFQRVASVTAGVFLALLVADVLGLHWWSVGLVIFDAERSCRVRLERQTAPTDGIELIALETLDRLAGATTR